jgi:hypothetical protein
MQMEMVNGVEWRPMETKPVRSETVNKYMLVNDYTFEIRMALFIAVAAAEMSNNVFEEKFKQLHIPGKMTVL